MTRWVDDARSAAAAIVNPGVGACLALARRAALQPGETVLVPGLGQLPGAVAEQEPEVRCAVAEVHHEVADLLGGPWPVRIGGDPEDVDVAGAGAGLPTAG